MVKNLIMLDETGLLTCVEVKTPRSQKFGPAAFSVGKKKLKRGCYNERFL